MTLKELIIDEPTLCGLGSFVIFAGGFVLMTVWRNHYLRFVDAEHRFLKRLGIPEHIFASTRRIEESRGYVIAVGIMALLALALSVTSIALHLHYGRYWSQESVTH